jgi:hypothetical protein
MHSLPPTQHDDHVGFIRNGELFCQVQPVSKSIANRKQSILVKHSIGACERTLPSICSVFHFDLQSNSFVKNFCKPTARVFCAGELSSAHCPSAAPESTSIDLRSLRVAVGGLPNDPGASSSSSADGAVANTSASSTSETAASARKCAHGDKDHNHHHHHHHRRRSASTDRQKSESTASGSTSAVADTVAGKGGGDAAAAENEDEEDECDPAHRHGPACGHERVAHGDHIDFLVGDALHHEHDGHCDYHGSLKVSCREDRIVNCWLE